MLQHAQQFRLTAGTHVADLIEQDRPPFGHFELAAMHFTGIGERALFMAKQFAFKQRLGQSRTVDGDEGPVGTRSLIVQGLGDDLFPRPAFAENQHRQVDRGQAVNGAAHGLHRRAIADERDPLRHLLGQLAVRPQQRFAFARVLQRDRDLCREVAQRGFIFVRERTRVFVDDLKRAQQLVFAIEQRGAEQIPRLVAAGQIDLPAEPRVLIGIVDAQCFGGVNHLAHDARLVGQPQRVPFDPQRGARDHLLMLAIPEEDAGAVTVQQTHCLARDQFEQRLGFLDHRQCERNFQDAPQPFDLLS